MNHRIQKEEVYMEFLIDDNKGFTFDDIFEKYLHNSGASLRNELMELPWEVKDAIREVGQDIGNGQSKKRAQKQKDNGRNYGGNCNVIPGTNIEMCYRLLICKCYDSDKFDDRIRECLDHVSLLCPGKNKDVYFLTTQWDSKKFSLYVGYIAALRRDTELKIHFLYMNNNGITLMPV